STTGEYSKLLFLWEIGLFFSMFTRYAQATEVTTRTTIHHLRGGGNIIPLMEERYAASFVTIGCKPILIVKIQTVIIQGDANQLQLERVKSELKRIKYELNNVIIQGDANQLQLERVKSELKRIKYELNNVIIQGYANQLELIERTSGAMYAGVPTRDLFANPDTSTC
ncbi:hypothetical protein ACJX0J_042529, partial [Zea mays]